MNWRKREKKKKRPAWKDRVNQGLPSWTLPAPPWPQDSSDTRHSHPPPSSGASAFFPLAVPLHPSLLFPSFLSLAPPSPSVSLFCNRLERGLSWYTSHEHLLASVHCVRSGNSSSWIIDLLQSNRISSWSGISLTSWLRSCCWRYCSSYLLSECRYVACRDPSHSTICVEHFVFVCSYFWVLMTGVFVRREG